MTEKLLADPHSPPYEAARREMVEVLRQIGREDSRNGYTQMADDLAAGNLMEVPTWIALALMATRAPADLRSALEAEREADAFLVEWQQGGETWVHAHADEPTAVDQARKKGGTCTPLYRALAPTKGDAS